MNEQQFVCQICHGRKAANEVFPAELVRAPLAATIEQQHGSWDKSGYICLSDLNFYRGRRIEAVMRQELGDVSELEASVVQSLREHELISSDVNSQIKEQATFGERTADTIAALGGSWTFIVAFAVVLASWIALNSVTLFVSAFDPYPYILLNLVLSCLAAIQAPIIMMSQNRAEARDRLRAENDYRVNLKAELEIRHLHEKIDHMLHYQWRRLVEIQQMMMEFIEDASEQQANAQRLTADTGETKE